MNRQTLVVAALGAVLVLALYYMFAWRPKSNEVAQVETQIEAVVAQQATVEAEVRRLEEVRAQAPAIEASLAAAEAILPRDAALPSMIRQLVVAAEDSGVTLLSVTPGRGTQVEELPGLSEFKLSIAAEGGYFQMVDFMRRVEDPALVARGIAWDVATLAPLDYPTLSATLTGTMFAQGDVPPPPAEEPVPAEGDDPGAENAPEGEAS